jgi:antitoxin component of MazEF toxin-antitoxin module
MKSVELKVAAIGNSRGVRLPAETLKRYGIETSVVMEERTDGILLRPVGRATAKLSWEDTAREMAERDEDWGDWDAVVADGLGDAKWDPGKARRVAQPKASYAARKRRGEGG